MKASFGRFGTGDGGPVKLTLESPAYPVTLSAEGVLSRGADGLPSYQGKATVAGVQPPEKSDAPRSPWADFQALANFDLTAKRAEVKEAQISYGAMERPLILTASGRLDFGDQPRFDVSVKTRQLDVDRSLGGGPDKPVSIDAAFKAFAAALPSLPHPRLAGVLHLDAQGVVVGGSVVQAVGADLEPTTDGWRVADFAAMLPGETRLDLNGALSAAGGPAFHGHARVSSARPAAFAAWWRGRVGSAAALETFATEADPDLDTESLQFRNIVATTGDGTAKGSVELRRFQQSGEIFANVSLTADRADLVKARALAELLAGGDFGSGRVDQMTLSLSADVLSAGGVEAHSVLLDGGLEGGVLQLRRLSVADLAGAAVEARGSVQDPFGAPSGRLEASVKADDISGAATFLGHLMPQNGAVAQLSRLAPLLSPFQADISAVAGPHEPFSIDLTGSFADTHVRLTAVGEGTLRQPESLAGSLKVHVDGEDSAKVLAQLGLGPLPVQAGPVRLDADFEGSLASGGKLDAKGTVAGIDLSYAAESSTKDGKVGFAGDFKAASADIDPALLLAGLALPGLGEGHAASASGRLEIGGGKLQLALADAAFDGEPVAGSLEAQLGEKVSLGGKLT